MLPLFVLILAAPSFASVSGRFSVGGYWARETLQAPDEDPAVIRNDVATFSGRAYLRVDEDRWAFVTDLRDKHDFFDKYDRERTQLTGRNQLQAREVYARRQEEDYAYAFGRLGVADAGVIFVDGGWIERRWGDLSVAAFGGLNPKRDDQTYVEWNPRANVYGVDSVYRAPAWFLANALVLEQYDGVGERAYWYDTFNWSNEAGRHVYGLGYLDFVPHTRVQTASLQWREPIAEAAIFGADVYAVDVIEYARRQALRETLAPSPYHEGGVSLELGRWEARSSFGERIADGLTRVEHTLGFRWRAVFGPRWDLVSAAIYRKNFTSRDTLGRVGLGYYSDQWEWTADVEGGRERYTDGVDRNPLALRLGCSRYLASGLFATLGLDFDHDERTNIVAALFQIAYRFGSRRSAPIRDGAPNRSRL